MTTSKDTQPASNTIDRALKTLAVTRQPYKS